VNAATDPPIQPELTDGVILLRPLCAHDAPAHLAGEDDAMAKWVSGGRSTLASVQTFIDHSQDNWRNGGPRRACGIVDCGTHQLIGFIEANFAIVLAPGQVNVSYGVFQQWRGRGVAERAIELMCNYLRAATDAQQMVLRIDPANTASLRVAVKAGFTLGGCFDEPEGRRARYVRDLSS
jgi:RimJ/RimL family protein N-acetyltransferase